MTTATSALRSALLFLFLATTRVLADQAPQANVTAPQVPTREVAVAASAFSRGDPLPAWAEPLSEVPATSRKNPLVVRLAESQFYAGMQPAYLVNQVLQANEVVTLSVLGQSSIEFIPEYQKFHLHKLQILRGQEKLDRTMQANVRFLQRETGLAQGMYSGAVTAVLLIEDVRVGDSLQIIYSLEGQNPVFGGVYSELASWDRPDPTELRRVWLIAPTQRKIEWRQIGDFNTTRIKPEVSEKNGIRRSLFEERGFDAIDGEANVPPDYAVYRFLQFSEYGSWNKVARWAGTLFPPVTQLPPELEALVTRLRALPGQEAQAAAALQWVQEEIRYFSTSLGESSHRPYPPATVVERRFGDCKDKTYLLITLLRALGIEANPVLLSGNVPRGPARVLPSATVFDHVVVKAQINGNSYYLDGTRLGQKGGLQTQGPVVPGAQALEVRDTSEALSEISYPQLAQLNRNELIESVVLANLDGDATLHIKQVWHGSEAEMLRLTFANLSQSQREKATLGQHERRYPGVTLIDGVTLDDDQKQNQYTLTANFRLPKALISREGVWGVRYMAGNLVGVMEVPKQATRNFPLSQPRAPYQVNYQLNIQWPDNVRVHRDADTDALKSDIFTLRSQHNFRGNTESISVDFNLLKDRVPPADVPRLMEDLKKLDNLAAGVAYVMKSEVTRKGLLGNKSLKDNLQAQFQTRVDRTTKALASTSLQGEDRASALCERATAYYNLEKYDEGMADAVEAVKIAPDLARAYVCRADLYSAKGKLSQSQADYTKALSLGAEPADIYYCRGRVRAYAGQLDAAAADFAKASQESDGQDLYPSLWEVWTLQRAGRPLPERLLNIAKAQPTGAWPRPALAMLTGAISPEQMLQQLKKLKGDDFELSQVEANYYLGQYQILHGLRSEAQASFEKVRQSGVTMYIEYMGAYYELQAMAATH